DSGGGAGIQADLKTFSAFRVFGMSVVTAVTPPNCVGVAGVVNPPPAIMATRDSLVLPDLRDGAAQDRVLSAATILQIAVARPRPAPGPPARPVGARSGEGGEVGGPRPGPGGAPGGDEGDPAGGGSRPPKAPGGGGGRGHGGGRGAGDPRGGPPHRRDGTARG